MKDNTIEKAIKVLTEHNKWRNKEPPYSEDMDMPYNSEMVTLNITYACKYLEQLIRLSKETRELLDVLQK